MSRQFRQPAPPRITNAPELLPGLDVYMIAFQRLTATRALGQGCIGAIPYTAINEYCRSEGILDEELREDIFYHVEHLDLAYIQWQNEKAKAEAEARSGG